MIRKYIVVTLTLLMLMSLSGCSKERKEAVANFNEAVTNLEIKTNKLEEAVKDLGYVLNEYCMPLDYSLIEETNRMIVEGTKAIKDIPKMMRKTDDIIKQTEEINSISYDEIIEKITTTKTNLINSNLQYKQVVNPSERFVLTRIAGIEEITEIEAATEDNDPNHQLHKQGGYTSAVFFAISGIKDYSSTYRPLLERGTRAGGCVEVYETEEEASKRNDYLSAFDGSALSPGSHFMVGSIIIRISNELTVSEQNTMTQKVIEALIRLD